MINYTIAPELDGQSCIGCLFDINDDCSKGDSYISCGYSSIFIAQPPRWIAINSYGSNNPKESGMYVVRVFAKNIDAMHYNSETNEWIKFGHIIEGVVTHWLRGVNIPKL